MPNDSTLDPTALDSVRVTSETGVLRRVVIGNPEGFRFPDEPINIKQARYFEEGRPTIEAARPEFAAFRAALESRGIEVVTPRVLKDVPDQLTPRDIGFVVDDIFVVAGMGHPSRQDEWRGIDGVINALPSDKVLRVPDGIVVEGGDVVLDKGAIYVGVSERSTEDGVAFLRERFGHKYEVIGIPLRSGTPGEDILHLDCAFVPVGANHALIYRSGMEHVPERIAETYELIDVTGEDQRELHSNVLSISPEALISRDVATRVNADLRGAGIEVIEIPFDQTPKSGGSVRCASLPLVRD